MSDHDPNPQKEQEKEEEEESLHQPARRMDDVASKLPDPILPLNRREKFTLAKHIFQSRDAPRYHEARRLCEEILASHGQHARAMQLLGMLDLAEGNFMDAEGHLQQAISVKPHEASLHSCMGMIYKAQSEHNPRQAAKAKDSFKFALKLSPGDVGILTAAASYYQSIQEVEEACRLLELAASIDPSLTGVWYKLGKCYSRLDKLAEAKQSFETAVSLDPSHARAKYWLASVCLQLGVPTEMPSSAPADYVAMLFDGYADRFDEHLTKGLGYRTPSVLMDLVLACSPSPSPSPSPWRCEAALDLGCGTGLSGEAIRPYVSGSGLLVGVDLSTGMLKKAEERRLYNKLVAADLVECFQCPGIRGLRFDLFFAADVFVYLGDLRPVLEASIQAARRPALLAFSTEALDTSTMRKETEGGSISIDYHLGPSGRFSHSSAYLHRLAKELGVEVLAVKTEIIRHQKGEALSGHLAVFRIP